MPSFRVSSQASAWTPVSHIVGRFFSAEPPEKARNATVGSLALLQGIFSNQELNWGLLLYGLIIYQLSYHRSPNPCEFSCSVVSNSLRPHGLYPTRHLCPWDFPGKNTGVGCHSSGDLPDPGIRLSSPAMAGGLLLPLSHLRKPILCIGSFN